MEKRGESGFCVPKVFGIQLIQIKTIIKAV